MSGKRIVRLEIEDFQSHKHTVIELAPGLTIFTGPTDQGKSAIRRAVELLYTNEPASTDNIRTGSNRMRVSATLEDGTRVTRERTASGSTNCYILERPGELPQKLEGFGRSVPEIIQEALGVRPIFLRDEPVYLNFAEQLEGPFLLTTSGSVRAEAIGRLTGVHLIDEATDDVVYDEQTALSRAKQAREEAEIAKTRLEAYKDLPEQEEAVVKLEEILARAEIVQERLAKLRSFDEQIRSWKSRMREVLAILKRLEHLDAVEQQVEKARLLWDRLEKLQALQSRHEANQQALAAVDETLAQTAHIEQVEQKITRAAELTERLDVLRRLQAKWIDLERRIEENDQVLERTQALPKVEAAVAQAQEIHSRLQALTRIAAVLRHNQENLAATEAEIQRTSSVDVVSRKVENAKATIERLEKMREFERRIREWKRQMRPILNEIARLNAEEKRVAAEYEKALIAHGHCPTCGQNVDPDVLQRHLAGTAG